MSTATAPTVAVPRWMLWPSRADDHRRHDLAGRCRRAGWHRGGCHGMAAITSPGSQFHTGGGYRTSGKRRARDLGGRGPSGSCGLLVPFAVPGKPASLGSREHSTPPAAWDQPGQCREPQPALRQRSACAAKRCPARSGRRQRQVSARGAICLAMVAISASSARVAGGDVAAIAHSERCCRVPSAPTAKCVCSRSRPAVNQTAAASSRRPSSLAARGAVPWPGSRCRSRAMVSSSRGPSSDFG